MDGFQFRSAFHPAMRVCPRSLVWRLLPGQADRQTVRSLCLDHRVVGLQLVRRVQVGDVGTHFSTSWSCDEAVCWKIWTQCQAAEVNLVDDGCEVVGLGWAESALPRRYRTQPSLSLNNNHYNTSFRNSLVYSHVHGNVYNRLYTLL